MTTHLKPCFQLFILASILFLLSSCSKSNQKDALHPIGNNAKLEKLGPLNDPDVYVAGWEDSVHLSPRAKYWVNGVPYSLPGGEYAVAIALSGSDVHIVGTKSDNAIYWKNGVPTTLVKTGYTAIANGITVFNGDVYVAGSDDLGNVLSNRPVYWKNGIQVQLTTGGSTISSSAKDIAVNGTNVYVVGTVDSKPVIWKNGVLSYLSDTPGMALSIAVIGADIYICGYDFGNRAAYWKNGVKVILPGGVFNPDAGRIATGIYVYNGVPYCAGYTWSAGAKYWINNSIVALPCETIEARANDIAVFSGNIYVAGLEDPNNGLTKAKYWINSNPINLTDGTKRAEAMSIAIKPN
ncbi:hypothetical protein CLV59_106421 [Chitinophaga dinghuensis]|uniref:Uncharacterized protein n=1 Tax=Chitinophaga dinghuensis TaxID=1539050 RepID=A0A327VVW3_9BACT|nr:hypothetical protein [Chitinophaga dinghuensis]RAJ79360.1 hypothetical protein CLV59_106421 [Chitinophaga dinghuensis]